MEMKRYISIDIGGTAIKYGMIENTGGDSRSDFPYGRTEILCRYEQNTEAGKGGGAILKKVMGIVEKLQSDTPVKGIDGICISTAGIVDTKKGEIRYSAPLIPDYTGINFKRELENRFGIPCEVENDVNCAGLAEAVSGAAKGCRAALMLTIGTGIGGCILLNGKVFHGAHGSACEAGYLHMRGSDFQTLGAASVLSRKVARWKGEPEEIWSGYHIFEEAKKGDRCCNRAIDEMVDVLGEGIADLCYVINPEIVILGGGIMAQKEFLKGKIDHAVEKYLIPQIKQETKLAFAKHGNSAGMLGAYYHFLSRHLPN